jgi:hypothetical protein
MRVHDNGGERSADQRILELNGAMLTSAVKNPQPCDMRTYGQTVKHAEFYTPLILHRMRYKVTDSALQRLCTQLALPFTVLFEQHQVQ